MFIITQGDEIGSVARRHLQERSLRLEASGRRKLQLLVFAHTDQSFIHTDTCTQCRHSYWNRCIGHLVPDIAVFTSNTIYSVHLLFIHSVRDSSNSQIIKQFLHFLFCPHSLTITYMAQFQRTPFTDNFISDTVKISVLNVSFPWHSLIIISVTKYEL